MTETFHSQAERFSPSVWPEEPAPEACLDCQKCELSKQRTRVVWGEGNPNAAMVVILDNPGAREDAMGEPFVCGTRQTLQRAAAEAGLGAGDLYITYILKCRPIRSYNKPLARSICSTHLTLQLETGQPKLAFCLGNTALQSFSGDGEAEVKHLRGQLQTFRGIPAVVSYHPLAVRRRPNLYPHFVKDWMLAAEQLKTKYKISDVLH